MNGTPDSLDSHNEAERPAAVDLCLLLGRILFRFGATTQRIQDSIASLAGYLGCKVEVLVSYDALLITINEGGSFRTRIDSARGVVGLNLLGLVRVSQFLRDLPRLKPEPGEIERELCRIRDSGPVHGAGAHLFAAGCAGAGFCIANGGDPPSWAGSFVAAALIFAVRRLLAARHFNHHLTLFAVALTGSFVGSLLAWITHSSTPAVALIAPVLYLVPGSFLISGGIDLICNHVTIGIARIGFAVAAVVALVVGVGLTVRLLPVQLGPPFSIPGIWEIVVFSLAGALAAAALACLNNGGFALMALCALGGLVARLVRSLAALGGLDLISATLVGVFCSSLLITFLAERRHWPSVLPCVMAALPMVPGYFAIVGLHTLLMFAGASEADPVKISAGLQALARALFISMALVAGVIGPVIILRRERARV